MDRPQPITRRQRHMAARKARILDAAAQVFSEKGFERATTREIAELADVGEGTVFNYFGSKNGLLLTLALNTAEEVSQTIAAASTEGIEDFMARVMADHFRRTRANPLLTVLLHEARLDEELRQQFVDRIAFRIARELEQRLRELSAQGVLRPANAAVIARALIGVMLGFGLLFETDNDPAIEALSPEELAAELTSLFLDGLRPRPAEVSP